MLHPDEPERARRHDQPEAVDEEGADRERAREGHRVQRADRAADARQPENEKDESRDHLDDLPDAYLADADEDLRVLGLGQRVVECPLLHIFQEPLHVRLDEGVNEAAEQDLHTDQGEELRLRPTVQFGCVRVDEREHHEPGADLDQ